MECLHKVCATLVVWLRHLAYIAPCRCAVENIAIVHTFKPRCSH